MQCLRPYPPATLRILLLFAVASALCAGVARAGPPDEPESPAMEPGVDGWVPVSDSPWLRLPEHKRNLPPLLPPASPPSGQPRSDDPTAVVVYEVATGQVYRFPSDDPSQQPVSTSTSTPSFRGLLQSELGMQSVIGDDDRERVHNTTDFPWCTISRLISTYSSGYQGVCTGWMVDDFHLVTAGHCVFRHENDDGWAESVEVLPALDVDYMPYGHAWAVRYRSYEEWTISGMSQHDWAVVTLDRNIGRFTGWMGRATYDPSDSNYTSLLNEAGYPGWQEGAWWTDGAMLWDADYGHSADEFNHWYWIDDGPGQSGAPVWTYRSSTGERYVLSWDTCGTGGCGIDSKGVNHGTRLNNEKYNRLETWRTSDSAPTDRADLIDDGNAASGFGPTALRPGSTTFGIWNRIRNVGTAASSIFSVYYYLSTNDNITASDRYLGADLVGSIAPFDTTTSDWQGQVPAGTADGVYWVGWIVDATSAVPEFEEDNNTVARGTVTVDGTEPTATITINSGATYTSLRSVSLDLSYFDGGSGVNGCRYGNAGGTWSEWQGCVGTRSWTLSSGDGTKTVYYEVRDRAGNVKQVSDTIVLDTTAPLNPTSCSETHGAPNDTWQRLISNAAFTWSGASDSRSGVSGYYVYWGGNSSGTSTTFRTTASYDPGAVPSGSTHYLRVSTKDNAGNSSAWTTLFTFKFDGTDPPNPTSCVETHGAPDDTWQNAVSNPAFTWSGVSDSGGSGLAGYYIYWGPSPSGTSSTFRTTASYDPGAVASGDTHYLRIRTEDNAGNSSSWTTLFTFRYDGTAPSNPTYCMETHEAPDDAWQNAVSNPGFIWSGASDSGGSGLAGYYVYWGASLSGTSSTFRSEANYIPGAVASGDTRYLRVSTKDNAGNTGGWTTLFTFRYDGTNPSSPTTCVETHGALDDTWQNTVSNPAFTWSGAQDSGGSGIAGYNVYWGTSPSGTSSTLRTTASYDPGAVVSGSTHYLRMRSRDNAGNSSAWTTLFTFRYDGTAPSQPTNCTETHGAPDGTWQNTVSNPAFAWSGASDSGGSGIAGYDVYWGTSPSGTSSTFHTAAEYDPGAVASGTTHYLRVRSKDNAGNTSAWTTLFTFRYDGTAPTSPTTAVETHGAADGTWQNTVAAPAFTWSGAADSASGVLGYHVYWGMDSKGTSTELQTSSSYVASPVSSPSTHYLRVRTVDNAGNTSGWDTLFVLKYDADPPDNPSACTESHGALDDTWQNEISNPSFTWSGAQDRGGSGVDGYLVYWGIDAAGTSADFQPGATMDSARVSSPSVYYLRVQTTDRAGNSADWTTLFTFRYDSSAPANPSEIWSPSHTVGEWSNDETVDVGWSAASDGRGSGLAGYSISWTTEPDSVPPAEMTVTDAGATSPPLADGRSWYFHLRSVDNTANWTSGAVHQGPFWIDSTPPDSSVDPLPEVQTTASFVVSWSGDDPGGGSGVASYDVQYRENDGAWVDWLSATTLTSELFGPTSPVPVRAGQTYSFRCRARDTAGNVEAYLGGAGDTSTRIELFELYLPLVVK